MPGPRMAVPRDAAARPRGLLRLACGSLLLLATLVTHFPSSAFAPAPSSCQPATAPWVAASAAERMDLPRGERTPRTQLHGRYAEGTRSRKNNQGGGRLPIRMNRKPVLSYSVADANEPASSVLRRMWDVYDMDFNKMVALQSRYFRPDYRRKQWTADYNMRMGRQKRLRREKTQAELEWQDFMRRRGRNMGLTDPVVYKGPVLKMTPEEDAASEPEAVQKYLGTAENRRKNIIPRMPKGKDRLPKDIEPGEWIDDGPENIFKIWKRPLHRWPFDIGKRGSGPICRNIVY